MYFLISGLRGERAKLLLCEMRWSNVCGMDGGVASEWEMLYFSLVRFCFLHFFVISQRLFHSVCSGFFQFVSFVAYRITVVVWRRLISLGVFLHILRPGDRMGWDGICRISHDRRRLTAVDIARAVFPWWKAELGVCWFVLHIARRWWERSTSLEYVFIYSRLGWGRGFVAYRMTVAVWPRLASLEGFSLAVGCLLVCVTYRVTLMGVVDIADLGYHSKIELYTSCYIS